jgi:ubiquinone/menaquinone biosynthesis C-methylase UbiE
MKARLLFELDRFINSLSSDQKIQKTTAQSRDIYQGYDDREIRAYFSESSTMLFNGRPVEMSFHLEREIHLSYVYNEIDALLAVKDRVKILEIGCGNCINIFEILRKYGDKVSVSGIDISENRIANGRKYFSDVLSNANLSVSSITERTPFNDNTFDLVYSMFCLEQIAYDIKPALTEMYRIASRKVLMLEPVFENADFLQKIYLIHSDHTRILLSSINELGLPLVRNEVMSLQCNPSNQSSVLILEKIR